MTGPYPRLDAESAYEKFMLHDPAAVRARLQQLIDARATVTALDDTGAASMLTAPLAIDGDTLLVDPPPGLAVQTALLASRRLYFEGTLDRVTLRFSCGPARTTLHRGRPALAVPLPTQLLHLQRRETMRREPPAGALRCTVPVEDGDPPRMVDATIRDIGGGGLAVLVPEEGVTLAVGDVLPGCMLELPDGPPLAVTLRVQHVQRPTVRGRVVLQAGCQFIDLRMDVQARLFRYVMQLDREQASRRRERA